MGLSKPSNKNQSKKTKKSIYRKKNKLSNEQLTHQQDDNTNSILKRMIDGGINEDTIHPSNRSNNNLFDIQTLLTQRKDRFGDALTEKYHYDSSIKRGQDFLLKHVNSKVELVVMYADLVGSTKMSMTLPAEKMVTIIHAFSYELASVIESHNGYVLKFSGDAVISFFPSSFNKLLVCDKSVQCGRSIIEIIRKGLNPVLKKNNYPELAVKIGIDDGENIVVQYGNDKSSPIDVLGYCMNVTSKITSLTAPNKVSIGENVFKLLHPRTQPSFIHVSTDKMNWKYINKENGNLYKFYTLR